MPLSGKKGFIIMDFGTTDFMLSAPTTDMGSMVTDIMTALIITEVIVGVILCIFVPLFKPHIYKVIKERHERDITKVMFLTKGKFINLSDDDVTMIRQEVDNTRIKRIGEDNNA